MKKTLFSITGMHCASCAMAIDGDLEDTPGIAAARTNYAKGELEVEFDEAAVSSADIVAIVKKTGYEAQER